MHDEYSFRYIWSYNDDRQIAALRQRRHSGRIPFVGRGLYRRPHRPERSPHTESGCDLLCPRSGLLSGRGGAGAGRRHPFRHAACTAHRGPRTLRGLRRTGAEIYPQTWARAMASRRRDGRHASCRRRHRSAGAGRRYGRHQSPEVQATAHTPYRPPAAEGTTRAVRAAGYPSLVFSGERRSRRGARRPERRADSQPGQHLLRESAGHLSDRRRHRGQRLGDRGPDARTPVGRSCRMRHLRRLHHEIRRGARRRGDLADARQQGLCSDSDYRRERTVDMGHRHPLHPAVENEEGRCGMSRKLLPLNPRQMVGLADGNSFYCSCEESMQPWLHGKPIIVASNNDGCAIAMNRPAKRYVRMGDALFQIADTIREHGIVTFSSNYELYGLCKVLHNPYYV